MQQLLDIMRQLRDPETGCPWDIRQDFSSIAPYTIEEAYEVADAIERGDFGELKNELGDLLFQVVFHSQMAQEGKLFGFQDVLDGLCDKMTRRHPHVFAGAEVADAESQSIAWEEHKAAERKHNGAESLLDDVPRGMAELQRAVKLQKRAAVVGFDWDDPEPVLDKFEEELEEIRAAISNGDADAIEDELGDLLFVVTNLARKLKTDPARALRRANGKFERRFRALEAMAGGEAGLEPMGIDQMEALWQTVKRREGEQE
jgi:MazG family protein